MSVVFEAIPVPLHDDGHGGLRLGASRVSFESVWHAYQQGDSPTAIVEAYDTLEVADVCAALAWALRHPDEVEAYLKRRDEQAAEVRRKLEAAGVAVTREQAAELKTRLTERQKE